MLAGRAGGEDATSVRIGLATPCVTWNPGNNNDWELRGTPQDVVKIAQAADRLGYHHLTCSEHVGYPAERETVPGMGRYWDPLATLSFLAAVTTRIRLETHILVLPYHHPLAVAKRYGTLDLLSGGRLVLGVGVGHLVPEFELLGADFEHRNEVTDDAIRALRAALGRRRPHYEGPYFRFADLLVDPHAVQERVPIWIGGQTRRSLQRAAALGDAWVPFALEFEDLRRLLDQARGEGIFEDRAEPLDLVFYIQPRVNPLAQPEATTEALLRYRELGATVVTLRIVHDSPEHCVEQLEAMRELADRVDPDHPMGA